MKIEEIDGSTRIFGIVADPISAVRSPHLFNAMFTRQGVNAVLVPLHVDAAGFPALWSGLRTLRNLAGLVITMPHKAVAATLVDELGVAGQIAGAINAARRQPDGRWLGDMFDGQGFVDGLLKQGHTIASRRAHLLGLGGAGTAIAVALAEAGVAALALQDSDEGRRERVIGLIRRRYPHVDVTSDSPHVGTYDMVINATPLGMKSDDPLPYEPARLPPRTLVVDVVTKPEMTPLLLRAESSGHRIHTGRHMHEGQAARAARFFGLRGD